MAVLKIVLKGKEWFENQTGANKRLGGSQGWRNCQNGPGNSLKTGMKQWSNVSGKQ